MTRDEFVKLLTRGMGDGWLTEERAIDLLRRFDRGETVDVKPPSTLGKLLRMLGGFAQAAVQGEAARGLLGLLQDTRATDQSRLPQALRIDTVDRLQDDFEARARALAGKLMSSEITPAQWQAQMGMEIRLHSIQQGYLATGSEQLTPEQMQRLEAAWQRELAYLSRFADQVAVAGADGKPLSEAHIGARAELYGGSSRGEHFRIVEESEVAAGRLGEGWVIYYSAKGDASTCTPCGKAEQYYLVGEGPMPAELCQGRSRCRCRRLAVYAPEIYAELKGGT